MKTLLKWVSVVAVFGLLATVSLKANWWSKEYNSDHMGYGYQSAYDIVEVPSACSISSNGYVSSLDGDGVLTVSQMDEWGGYLYYVMVEYMYNSNSSERTIWTEAGTYEVRAQTNVRSGSLIFYVNIQW